MTNTDYPSATPTNNNSTNNNKNIIIGVLAAGLLITWGYLLWTKNKSEKEKQELKIESANYFTQRDSIKLLYDQAEARLDTLTNNNAQLQSKLTDRQKDIGNLRTEIRSILAKKNASDAELNKAKELIAQLNEKINNLEADIVKLTGENRQLTAVNASLQEEKTNLEQNLQTSKTENEQLAKTVDVGSTFMASNIQISPVHEKKSGKEVSTTKAKRVDKLVVSFDVVNRIAKSGPADMYLIVTAPDGKVISNESMGSGTFTTRNDGDKEFTVKVPIEYEQGIIKNIQFPIRQESFQTGDYKIEIYHNGFKIGEGVRSLKKGSLFG
jgi:hypothetical protein